MVIFLIFWHFIDQTITTYRSITLSMRKLEQLDVMELNRRRHRRHRISSQTPQAAQEHSGTMAGCVWGWGGGGSEGGLAGTGRAEGVKPCVVPRREARCSADWHWQKDVSYQQNNSRVKRWGRRTTWRAPSHTAVIKDESGSTEEVTPWENVVGNLLVKAPKEGEAWLGSCCH